MKRKNILFLFSDQHRGDWLPFDNETFEKMGNPILPIKMDNVKKLMVDAAVFTDAITNSPLCVPARACLASGMNYDTCGVFNNDFCYPLKRKSFYKVLQEGGYNVGGVGKFDLHKPILFWNEDGWIDQLGDLGFTKAVDSEGKYDLLWSSFHQPMGPYSAFLHKENLMKQHAKDYIMRYYNSNDARATSLPDHAYSDNWVTDNALKMLVEMKSEDKPWFMMVNFTGPHNPWDITKEMKEKWQNVDFPLPHGFSGNKEEINEVRQNYAAMLENIDSCIGKILNQLRADGTLEDTLIVYSADHGEMMGDDNRFLKSVPSRGAIQIPLIISGCGVKKGYVCDELVQLNDLAATFVEFADLKMPPERDSISLLPMARGEENSKKREFQVCGLYNSPKSKGHEGYENLLQHQKKKQDHEYIEEFNQEFNLPKHGESIKKLDYKKDWFCIKNKKYKLIEYANGDIELFDIKNDIWEQSDIGRDNAELIEKMKMEYNVHLNFDDENAN